MIDCEFVLICLNTVTSMIVLWSAICAADHMTTRTPHSIRIAFILVGVGAAAQLLSPPYLNRIPTAPELLLITGVAVLSIIDRRRRIARMFAKKSHG